MSATNPFAPAPTPPHLAAPLSLDIGQIKGALTAQVNPHDLQLDPQTDAPLFDRADEVIQRFLDTDLNDSAARESLVNAVAGAGFSTEKNAMHRSKMLQQRMGTLRKDTEDGGPVASALSNLRSQVESLNPAGIDFTNPKQAARRLLGFIPMGNKVKEYFERYESADAVINDIVEEVKRGREVLERDTTTLQQDRTEYWQVALDLTRQVKVLMAIDQRLSERIDAGKITDPEQVKFLQDEILFTLRQRTQDLQQRVLVNIQGSASCDILIRTNKELMRGVDRALHVTVDALRIAVSVALALSNQKLVLRATQALNATTNNLLASTAQMLNHQGAEILEEAAKGQLSQTAMREAFANIFEAFDKISTFKQEALPHMAQQILEFDQLTEEAAKRVQTLEAGNRISEDLIQFTV
ncbi:toxic anion resistance protein [Magnetofaba australis]|uniref:Putative toxic anion resistance family protein n=1 Tax=Magnetofaba australis IT-1 TaxID=1434232 RepID=A0A1Y2K349_9PROT|nr:toxic anion resistance protein [Magnetofaba australis]OSM01594.1 putative toxic anion resistance family protein [Magnetofaba australis IT-1]